ncbi:MAG: DUF4920 domain-containing protein [Calditrichaeota bacterium]|nr:DUF4920 domain-containing protein [Calditrichota bacterium]MCB9369136.1 DUF4920 domain-containing protein [Calditrichota bacterium]
MKTKAILLLAISAIILTACSSSKQMQTFGEAPTLKHSANVTELNANPAAYVDQDVLISGKVVDMCMHMGCWVEIEQADNSKILCKSLDESVTFPQETLGKEIELQGKLMYDENAPGYVEEKGEGEEAHACPAPAIMVAIKGAKVKGL